MLLSATISCRSVHKHGLPWQSFRCNLRLPDRRPSSPQQLNKVSSAGCAGIKLLKAIRNGHEGRYELAVGGSFAQLFCLQALHQNSQLDSGCRRHVPAQRQMEGACRFGVSRGEVEELAASEGGGRQQQAVPRCRDCLLGADGEARQGTGTGTAWAARNRLHAVNDDHDQPVSAPGTMPQTWGCR